MDEGRKRVLLIAASILAARKLSSLDTARPGHDAAIDSAIAEAISAAQRILTKIDSRWPTNEQMRVHRR